MLFLCLTSTLNEAHDRLEDLLSRIALRDKNALAELYGLTKAAVYALALSVLKNPYDAQDVTQSVFLRIYSGAGSYEARGKPMAWIMTVTRNLALMTQRSANRVCELTDEALEGLRADDSSAFVEDRALIKAALSELSDEESQIVLLHAVAGLKHREIASVTGLALSTVLSKYQRALKKLKEALKEAYK